MIALSNDIPRLRPSLPQLACNGCTFAFCFLSSCQRQPHHLGPMCCISYCSLQIRGDITDIEEEEADLAPQVPDTGRLGSVTTSPSAEPHAAPALPGAGISLAPSNTHMKAEPEEATHADRTSASWKRFGFSGRPSCPAKSPSADEKRRRAAAAAGSALLESQVVQQQRWLLLHQRQNNKYTVAHQHQPAHNAATPHYPAASVDPKSSGAGHLRGRPVDPAVSELKMPLGSVREPPKDPSPIDGPYRAGSHAEIDPEKPRACPSTSLMHAFFALSANTTCPRRFDGDPVTGPLKNRSSSMALGRETRREKAGGKGPSRSEEMRPVLGGLEATVEEAPTLSLLAEPTTVTSKEEPSPASTVRGGSEGSATAIAGTGGAAVGEGEHLVMTWVLGATGADEGGGPAAVLEERDSLLDALEYSFMLHAEEVARESLVLGLVPGHAPAGSAHLATLQFSFDSVPLHEQRVIRMELGTGRQRSGSTPRRLILTPAQVQLSGRGGTEVMSLAEEGRMHSRGVFDEWIRNLDGSEGAAALQIFSLSLEDLRVILALEEGTSGPVSLVTAEDWGDERELSRLLRPAGGHASFSWELEAYSTDAEEEQEDPLNADGADEDGYWHWLIADPAAW